MTNTQKVILSIHAEPKTVEQIMAETLLTRRQVSGVISGLDRKERRIIRTVADGYISRKAFKLATCGEVATNEKPRGHVAGAILTYLTSGDKWTASEMSEGIGNSIFSIYSYMTYLRTEKGHNIKSERSGYRNQLQYWIETETQND